jgi:uncharacterized protein YbjT (DUF2867 family)/ketosteroid isomerase-like protein
MRSILVTGATGTIGSRIVERLRRHDAAVTAFVRDPERARTLLGADTTLAVGDFDDPESLAQAMNGVDTVFLTSANGPHQVRHESAVIDAARAADVLLLVKLSTVGAKPGSPLPGMDWHGRIEEHLGNSGVDTVILRCNLFMSNLLGSDDGIAAGTLAAPAGRGAVAMIDPDDVAAAAVAVLTGAAPARPTFELTGPRAVTHDQIADALAAAIGRPVRYVDAPADQAHAAFVAAGLPGWLVNHVDGAYDLIRRGALARTTGDVAELIGRAPRDVTDYASAHAALFGRTAAPAAETPAAVAQRFIDAVNARDLDRLGELYEPGASLHWPKGVVVEGQPAIRAALADLVAGEPDISGRVDEIITAGDIALSLGSWTMHGVAPDGNPYTVSGRTTDVLRRQPDRTWRMVIDNPLAM